MALSRCPDCNAEVSDAATACPSCGRPMKAASKVPGVVVILLFGVLLFVLALYFLESSV